MAEAFLHSGVADRYAEAAFALAEQGGKLDKIAADFADLGKMLKDSADLRALVKSPLLATADQIRALGAVAEKAGFDNLTRNFLGILAQNRRLKFLAEVLAAFAARLAGLRNEAVAEIFSAQELSKDHLMQLTQTLAKATGKNVKLATHVDPALLAGIVVKVGSRMIDTSLRSKLNSLKIAMKGVQ